MLKNFFANRKHQKQLAKYLDPEAVKAFAEGRIPQIQSGRIEFIFVMVRADNPEQHSARVGLVADAGSSRHAIVHHMVGPMVVMAFGTMKGEHCSPSAREDLVVHLRQMLGSNIKIVHGETDGFFGNFGSKTSVNFTFTFPEYDAALAALCRVEYGWAEEFQPSQP